MARSNVGLLVLVLSLAACGSQSEESSGGPVERAPVLRTGAAAIFDAGTVAWTEARVPGTEEIHRPFPGEVAVDGDRIVISFGVQVRNYYGDNVGCGSGAPQLLLSEDRGATWTTHTFPSPGVLYQDLADNCAPPVQASSGHVALLFTRYDDHSNPRIAPTLVSFSPDAYGSFGAELFDCQPEAPEAEGWYIRCYACRGYTNEFIFNTVTGQETNLSGVACTVTSVNRIELSPADFVSFNDEVTAWCRIDVHSGVTTKSCVPYSSWPSWAHPGSAAFVTSRGPMIVGRGTDGRVYATDVAPGATSSDPASPVIVDLGPGMPRVEGAHLKAPFGPLVRVEQEDGSHKLFDLLPGGVIQQVLLPSTPCVNDTGCGGGQAEHLWALPLGGDQFLDVYRVDTFVPTDPGMYGSTGAHRYILYAAIDHATRVSAVIPPAPAH